MVLAFEQKVSHKKTRCSLSTSYVQKFYTERWGGGDSSNPKECFKLFLPFLRYPVDINDIPRTHKRRHECMLAIWKKKPSTRLRLAVTTAGNIL